MQEEPRIPTEAGLRKPDIVAVKNGHIRVIDAQVVADNSVLDEAHQRKSNYYNTNEIKDFLAREHNIQDPAFSTTSATLNWRGAWSPRSLQDMQTIGLSTRDASIIGLRCLEYTHWIYTSFKKGTGRGRGRVGNG